MITKPTVFILGAGASKPFGYPTGNELKGLIVEHFRPGNTVHNNLKTLGIESSSINNFRAALFYSGKLSVDAFLEHRTEFIEVGKIAIAQVLTDREKEEDMFNHGDWYQYVYNKLNTSFEEFGENSVSFITFNYDRSLEHYLHTALKNSYGKSDDECALVLNKIPIIHLHGILTPFPWQLLPEGSTTIKGEITAGRPYGIPEHIDELTTAADSIKIIHEGLNVEEDTAFIEARQLIKGSKEIFFLGFGYDPKNLDRLAIDKVYRGPVFGTAKGLLDAQRFSIESSISFSNRSPWIKLSQSEADSLTMLKTYWVT